MCVCVVCVCGVCVWCVCVVCVCALRCGGFDVVGTAVVLVGECTLSHLCCVDMRFASLLLSPLHYTRASPWCGLCAHALQGDGAVHAIQVASSGLEFVSLLTDPLQLLVWPFAVSMDNAKGQEGLAWSRWAVAALCIVVRERVLPHAEG